MKNQNMHRFATSLIAIATLAAPLAGHAEIHSKSKEIVVVQPADLPEQTQTVGNDLFLHPDNSGRTYLYIEQMNGARLAVIDVTDPARIKSASTIALKTTGCFDFVKPLNNRAELVRFRQTGDVAVLDLTRAKQPTLRTEDSLAAPAQTEPIGVTGLLAVAASYTYAQPTPRDFQLVDVSAPFKPVLMTTIKNVEHRVTNDETGTTFLLGSEGLTVIRQPRVEKEYQAQEVQLDHN